MRRMCTLYSCMASVVRGAVHMEAIHEYTALCMCYDLCRCCRVPWSRAVTVRCPVECRQCRVSCSLRYSSRDVCKYVTVILYDCYLRIPYVGHYMCTLRGRRISPIRAPPHVLPNHQSLHLTLLQRAPENILHPSSVYKPM